MKSFSLLLLYLRNSLRKPGEILVIIETRTVSDVLGLYQLKLN
jgi:hypothetical protein